MFVKNDTKDCKKMHYGGSSGAVYGLGFAGAAIYYIQHAVTFQDGLLGLAKSIVWPAFLVYKLIETFKF